MNTLHTRLSGVLVHPTSSPSPYGIGDLGQGAYDFIDFLKASGQSFCRLDRPVSAILLIRAFLPLPDSLC